MLEQRVRPFGSLSPSLSTTALSRMAHRPMPTGREAAPEPASAAVLSDLACGRLQALVASDVPLNLRLHEGIGAHNVGALIDWLSRAKAQVHALDFELLDDMPVKALRQLLAALDDLPALVSLDIRGLDPACGKLSAVRRDAFAGSRSCVLLSLEVRRYLLRDGDRMVADDPLWQQFFESTDCLDAPTGDGLALRQNFDTRIRTMALTALQHRQGFLLKALKTVVPPLYLLLSPWRLAGSGVRLLIRLGIEVRLKVDVRQAPQLSAACRLVRNARLRVSHVDLVFRADVDARDTARVLKSVSKAPHLTELSISGVRGVCVAWPMEIGAYATPARGLKRLRLNVHAFAQQPQAAAQCIRAWSPAAVRLMMHGGDQLAVLACDDLLNGLRKVPSLTLSVHDEALSGEAVCATLESGLSRLLRCGHRIRVLHVGLECGVFEPVNYWDAWMTKAPRHLPLREITFLLNDPWELDFGRKLHWRLTDSLAAKFEEAFASGGANAFFARIDPLAVDVWRHAVGKGWLSLRDALTLAQVSPRTLHAAKAQRRASQLAELLELGTHEALDEDTLRCLARAGAHEALDTELLRRLHAALLTNQAGQAQLDLVERVLAGQEKGEAAHVSTLVRYKA